MSVSLRRKLYVRGGSYETTIPLQLLLDLDLSKKNEVIFEYDADIKKWIILFEPTTKVKKIKKVAGI